MNAGNRLEYRSHGKNVKKYDDEVNRCKQSLFYSKVDDFFKIKL